MPSPSARVRDRPGGGHAAGRLLRVLILAALLVLPPAAAQPVLAASLADSGQQDWLTRVVPGDLPPPSRPPPPIAIIEAAVDRTHPDMQGGWVTTRRFGPEPVTDEDVLDLAYGVAHGTAVASVIGAPRDGAGLEGVLPGARVWVYGSSPYCRDFAAAVRQAVRDGAKVINISAGFEIGGACRALRDATGWAFGRDRLVVASAGNLRPTQRWMQPGSDHHVLTVGALNAFDQPAGFSQQTIHLDLMAPGEGVLAAWPVLLDLDDGAADGYRRLDGTSFSAPMVAAAAAWLFAERPDLSADQAANVLRRSARDLGPESWDRAYGWGALDLRAALAHEAPEHDYLEPNEEIRWVNGVSGFRPAPALLGSRRSQTLRATVDVAEDPRDIYPVRIPIGARATISVDSPHVAVDLFVWQPGARRASEPGTLVARSRRPGTLRDSVTIFNPRSRRPAFIEVRSRRGHSYGGTYTLRLRRTG